MGSKQSTETAALAQNELDKDATNSDPRSPTPEIARTPLQSKNGAKHNITKNADLRKQFENGVTEEKLIHNNPILSAVIKNHLKSFDPRSPTQDFERTPIIIAPNVEGDKKLLKRQLENHNYGSPCLRNETIESNCDDSFDVNERSPDLVIPKNLCDGFYDMTLTDSLKESEEPLGSSTVSNEIIEIDMSKEKRQFLETNFDYVETEVNEFEDSEEQIDSTDKQDYSGDFKNIPLFKILNDDPRSPSTGIERTPIVVSKLEQDLDDKNVEEMSDDSLVKALQTEQYVEYEKPDGILIYEDAIVLNDTPKKSKSENNSGSRTPLSCMKNITDSGHGRSTTLLDSKNQKATKLQKRVSQIPRLKSLTHQSKYTSESSSSLKNICNSQW